MKNNIHSTVIVDKGAVIGDGTKIWHFSHVCERAKIGKNCMLGQNSYISNDVIIGNNVKIQNNVSIYSGTIIEDDVFLGPSCVLTNISNPRSEINRKHLFENTLIRKGATLGANSTIISGNIIGRYSFISAGAVITSNVEDYALMKGVPAKHVGWMSRHAHILPFSNHKKTLICPESNMRYMEKNGKLKCLDLDENAALPSEYNVGLRKYNEYKYI